MARELSAEEWYRHWKWWYWSGVSIGLGMMLFWIIGKLTGFIQSPLWIEMIPSLGGFVTLLFIAGSIGRFTQRFSTLEKRVDRMAIGLTHMEKESIIFRIETLAFRQCVENHMTRVESHMVLMENRVGCVEAALANRP